MDKYAYSTNEEEFYGEYETKDEAIQDAFDDDPDVDVIWVGKIVHASNFITDSMMDRVIDNMIDQIDGEHRFRLGMFNPNLVLDSIDELVQVMKSDHFFKFFHIPLQSGSDTILQAMGRKYVVKEWVQIVDTVRQNINNPTIATDIIVGFPGETEHDFDLTMDLISKVRPPVVNISKYGDRPGTLASRAKNKVDTSAKKDRSRRLTKLVNEILEENNKSWIGWTGPAIVTEIGSRGGFMCRNSSYKPIILDDIIELGTTVSIRIIDAERTHLFGEIIS